MGTDNVLLAACRAVDRDIEQSGSVSAETIDLVRAALALADCAAGPCSHKDTVSIYEDSGRALFRCVTCGAVRGSDPKSWINTLHKGK